ncbi:MAG: hypothetical protein WC539_04865 [Nitrospirota bacterium]
MKKYIITILTFSLFTVKGFASDIVHLTEHVDESGKRTVFVTTRAVLEKCPNWKLDKEPPYPIHKAIAVAQQWIKKKYPRFTNFRIVSISLMPIWDRNFKDRWYYSIAASAATDFDGISASSYFSTMVLMDGTVVGPSTPISDNKDSCQDNNPVKTPKTSR